MVARIYRPAKTAMQSGKAKTHEWLLVYEPQEPKRIDPLMGYTSSGDMLSQLRLTFETKEQAIDYAERNDIPYRVEEEKAPKRVRVAYADNFKYDRRQPWTH
ncbi:ETC complex I subunit conserved region [Fulvimarina manganoxydans]|uniref:ETC complex I subunit conserved region n=1 Tax=Fulvimarina manganoxydans TaxID=937218 RepID=A0A1W1Z831_9HYPH|nr:ETC complex I subunit [Fulvimarina manganoxydans]MCK5931466.1 ETC complex I subunit [Fulvimarina manganoxydans]MEE2952975.1 ETC complex I subunit [Pseudomonadota bacterium]SMC44301.1 ETC complex I subunit conserved region [Fulvimarina manganoxydans]